MSDETRRLVILGSTGSIGRQTLEVVRALPEHFKIIGLAGGENTALILEQINEFAPSYYYSSSEKELDVGDWRRLYMDVEQMDGQAAGQVHGPTDR